MAAGAMMLHPTAWFGVPLGPWAYRGMDRLVGSGLVGNMLVVWTPGIVMGVAVGVVMAVWSKRFDERTSPATRIKALLLAVLLVAAAGSAVFAAAVLRGGSPPEIPVLGAWLLFGVGFPLVPLALVGPVALVSWSLLEKASIGGGPDGR